MDLGDFRKEYSPVALRRNALAADPIEQFGRWFEEAVARQLHEPNAMTLATVGNDGRVLQRTVLLKGFDRSGFRFFTNYQSRKAREIRENPFVCALFPWITIERQVIIQGRAFEVSSEESDGYFRSRPRDSQLGAWVSEQSSEIASRQVLEDQLAELRATFADREIPRPAFWGGYRIVPETIEFWQGGAARLHDRFQYSRGAGDAWTVSRRSP